MQVGACGDFIVWSCMANDVRSLTRQLHPEQFQGRVFVMESQSLFDGDAVVLIDGKNFLFRNFYPHAKLKTQDGEPTGALFGCLNGLLSLAHRLPDSPIAFVWEGGGETWRHRLLKPREEQDKPKTVLGKKLKETGWFDEQVKKSVTLIQGGSVAQGLERATHNRLAQVRILPDPP